jgi:hypothetical protein
MKVVNIRMMVHAKSYEELVDKAEKRLALFVGTSVEDLQNRVNYEFNIYESSDDGISLSTFSAEVLAKLK